MSDKNQEQLQQWRIWVQDRHSAVTAPQGNLALIQTSWLNDGETFSADEVLATQPATVGLTNLEKKNPKKIMKSK